MRARALLVSPLVALMIACSGSVEPLNTTADSTIVVTVEKAIYTWNEVGPSGAGVRGTVTNRSDRTFYAALGDAFNSDKEQELLFIANGSDGTIERADGAAWMVVSGAQLIEGVKVIELRPGRPYSFVAQPSGSQTGTYRVTIGYRDVASGSSDAPHRTASATFEIR